MPSITIALLDDHKLFTQGLANSLGQHPGIEVIALFHDGKSLLKSIKEGFKADLLLIDLNLPGFDGLQTIEHLKKGACLSKILIVSTYSDEKLFEKCKKLGVDGYALKDMEVEELIESIMKIMNGEKVLNLREMDQSSSAFFVDPAFVKKFNVSKREAEVIGLICQGLQSNEIAEKLFLSKKTVETHRKNINHKLQVKNSVELVRFAMQNGFFDLHS